MSDENGKDVIFEVTEDHLNTGMRGIPVGTCRTSFVDPLKGVHYCGYPVGDLADMSPEDVIFLLYEKRLPNRQESQDFRHELTQRAERLPTGALRVLESLTPGSGHPMDWLSIGIQALGVAETTGDVRADGLNLIARMPELMATIFRLRGGRGPPEVASEPERGLVENFVHLLGKEGADAERMVRALRVFLVLHMDHGGGNLSTFTGKAVASGWASLYASMASAMNALSGPLHGRANQACLEFVQRIGTADESEVEAFVRQELAARRPIYGFGHAVLRAEDPRAAAQFKLGEELCPDDENFNIIKTLREVAPRVLGENPKISNPNANVDIASGTLLNAVGFHKPEYYTTFFGWARVAGISAQILDERNARGGRGTPIYRPKYIAADSTVRRLE
ncbi:MAG: citrate/2-methylcitrate synthase [Candidatus Thermoplasmatota archaeon]|nr:citrate/2-methylcitrate synthase [Candidatus Thermoplasmatota archaeon]